MKLYYHPLSTYSQKAVIAFQEKKVSFAPEIVALTDPAERAKYAQLYPLAKIPLLVLEDGWKIPESSIIIEYLDTHFNTGARLIPEDKDLARRVRFHDRQFDLYVNNPVSTIARAGLHPELKIPADAIQSAHATLDLMFDMLDSHFERNTWAVGENFSMADCAAAPPLAYARKAHPYEGKKHLTAYFGRLAERASVAKVLADAQPYLAKLAAR